MPETGKCRTCGAEIIWVVMAKSGKKNPLDAQAVDNGNIQLDADGKGHILSKDVIAKMREKGTALLYLSHFATCPQSREHRKPA